MEAAGVFWTLVALAVFGFLYRQESRHVKKSCMRKEKTTHPQGGSHVA